MYTFGMRNVSKLRDKVLKVLQGEMAGFFLAGGTALSLYYFHHRESIDLDFFTKDFKPERIKEIISFIKKAVGVNADLVAEQKQKGKAQMLIYNIGNKKASFKIDFVEDVYRLIKLHNVINKIPVLSIEDIYLRKIFAVCGSFEAEDKLGRKMFLGGRHSAKDFFDLYFLSKTFMRLSQFAKKYCSIVEKESILIWFSSFSRVPMKLGLKDLITDKKIDYAEMERHFRREIEEIVRQDSGS